MRRVTHALHNDEQGHVPPFLASLIAGAGLVAIGIGAAADLDWLAVVGGIVGGLGLVAYGVVHHYVLDREFFARTDRLVEK